MLGVGQEELAVGAVGAALPVGAGGQVVVVVRPVGVEDPSADELVDVRVLVIGRDAQGQSRRI